MSASRAKGTRWESQVVAYLQANGWPHAERRALDGSKDRGDVAGIAGVCVEAKSASRITLAEYVTETLAEKANAGARVAVTWLKRRGKASAADGYVIMTGSQFVELLQDAGYL